MTNVSIITIGDELLIGQVIDTNSAWMAQELNKAGFRLKRRVAVGDVWDEIWKALDEESAQADVVLLTGGLGPTADDITKPLLCEYFGGKLVQDAGALKNVTHLFEKVFKRPITARNVKQADVPDVCTVLQNKRGTAPGMLFYKGAKIFVSMPGVPHEMQGIMTDDVIPLLKQKLASRHIAHRTLITFGIGESNLADLIQDFEESLPAEVKLAYLPNFGMVRLRLTAQGEDATATEEQLDKLFEQLQRKVKDYLVTNEDLPMEQVLGKLLVQKGKTMATAESCTGGYIAHLLTSIPGSSAFYTGSVVSYANSVKEEMLKVDASILKTEGAVSEATVIAMLKGCLQSIPAHYGIAVSGIMGPDGEPMVLNNLRNFILQNS
ncbi:MAG: CinA family nicotinamide mononucleotide deamidase-related protein [Chitinophagaceae bacterium]|nr:MAG: CinA family nicotinamide mononucleotide deamidase-related protein [Chitinophagaceae bacterium]